MRHFYGAGVISFNKLISYQFFSLSSFSRFNLCINDCQQTINLNPDFVKAWRRKALAHFSLGDMVEAKRCYEQAIKLDPKDKSLKDEL